MIDRSIIEQIKTAIDFPTLVEKTTGPLPRRPDGRPVMVHCPWHDDHKTDSLAVYADHAHCFGCGWHGDCLDWVMERDNVGFAIALEELAQQAGVTLCPLTPEGKRAVQERRQYKAALGAAANLFVQRLQETPRALDYAHARGWSDETIQRERLGYADGDPLPDLGNEQAQRVAEALNRWSEKVGGALVYAHHDGGRAMYLSGRAIEGKKHYNPPADLAGSKQPYLNAGYSLRARELVIVEGQACSVTLGEWGLAGLGLAGSGLSGDLADHLRQHAKRGTTVYAVPDGNGRTDLFGLVEAVGSRLRIVVLPRGTDDTNDLSQSGAGADDFRGLLNAALPASGVVIVKEKLWVPLLVKRGIPATSLGKRRLTDSLASRLRGLVEDGVSVYIIQDNLREDDVAALVEAVGPLLRIIKLPDDINDVGIWMQQTVIADGLCALMESAPTWLAQEIKRASEVTGRARTAALRRVFEHLATLDTFILTHYREQAVEMLGLTSSQFNRYLKAVQDAVVVEKRNGREDGRYIVENGHFCKVRYGRKGNRFTEPLCNFTAEITADIGRDDGAEVTRQFTIAGRLENSRPLPTIRVDAAKFTGMSWAGEQWGVRAILRAGWRVRDQLREAIQLCSGDAESCYVYAHTGWREIEGQRVYLHADGAVGLEGVTVELDRELERYRLPAQPEDVTGAMEASLRFLGIGPEMITVPLWAAAYLAPLTEIVYPGFMLWLYGVSGTLKSTLAALALCHYGDFTDKDLFGWTDTANRLEMNCFLVKDAVLVIDDFAPQSDAYEARRLEQNVARVVRNIGNRGGRGRLARDLSLRPVYRPRGLVVSTGEQEPDGESITARMYTVEMHPGDVGLERLSQAQAEANRYPHAMIGYLSWLAGQWDHLAEYLPQRKLEQRERLVTEMHDSHLRVPDTLTTLYLGLDLGLAYAVDVGALSKVDADAWRERGWEALRVNAEAQAQRVVNEQPTVLFLNVLGGLVAQGRVWLKQRDGDGIIGDDEAKSELLGWYDDMYVYLIPKAVYNRVCRFMRDEGRHFPVKQRTLNKALLEAGYLHRVEEDRYSGSVWIDGRVERAIHLCREKIVPYVTALSCEKTG